MEKTPNTAKFSLYVSPYIVANQGGRYTKHIYIGSQRVVSKIGDFDSYGSDPRRIQYAGSETDGLSVDYKGKYTQQLQVIKDNYATFAVPYNGEDNNDYVDGEVVQHIEYLPFGEVFVEERNNISNNPLRRERNGKR